MNFGGLLDSFKTNKFVICIEEQTNPTHQEYLSTFLMILL